MSPREALLSSVMTESAKLAVAALDAAQVNMARSGHWRNAAGYQTDAALWITRAIAQLQSGLALASAEREAAMADLLGGDEPQPPKD